VIRCRLYLGLVLLLAGGLTGLFVWAGDRSERYVSAELPAHRQLVRNLNLTDLSLWTEARYTRHPSMADLFSPFQDHPGAFEHFPAGGLMPPALPRPVTTIEINRRERI